MSPVHDKYGKEGLVNATDRVQMLRLALNSSAWVHVSEWETHQDDWTPTREVLQYHQVCVLVCGNCAEPDREYPKGPDKAPYTSRKGTVPSPTPPPPPMLSLLPPPPPPLSLIHAIIYPSEPKRIIISLSNHSHPPSPHHRSPHPSTPTPIHTPRRPPTHRS
ncbi:Nicotinamide/nicotinic acid mononucleotide adenylyltransferase 2 [Portunus trituberculatus]|uniref:Nicotinamide/nicotinic acid mononucleotide adenylyltransferase 2 n=1 Tax=Portunus trituberculatus TaxID=210409 RepID=A0A5B7DYX5_PORTR|nr:Nicotinamide/nicotinic acid mononucleotide adenylyltransferase 2 [Portunus trituberculatus]